MIITFSGLKGSFGKMTLTTNIYEKVISYKKVLFVDADGH
ncbi:hypothetical protein BN1013_00204 [Candidatus Rubidus massiliensis]|nr:hypothetical protein BN1013_00204 [Candidatus Rubidus massiliensis]